MIYGIAEQKGPRPNPDACAPPLKATVLSDYHAARCSRVLVLPLHAGAGNKIVGFAARGAHHFPRAPWRLRSAVRDSGVSRHHRRPLVPVRSRGVEIAGGSVARRRDAPAHGGSGVAMQRGASGMCGVGPAGSGSAPAVRGIAVRLRRRTAPKRGVRSRHPTCVAAVPRRDPARRNSDPAPAGVHPGSRRSDPAPSGGPPREPEQRPRDAWGPPRKPEERPRAVRGPPREPEKSPRAAWGPPRKPEERPRFSRPGPRKAEETPRNRRGPPRAPWGSPRGRRGSPRNREAPAFSTRRRHSARPGRQN